MGMGYGCGPPTGSHAPSALSANQNDYAPTNKSATILFLSASTPIAITGLSVAQGDVTQRAIINTGASAITLSNQSASSAAANRFLNSTGADIVLIQNQAADLVYDAPAARWRVFKRT